MVPWQTEPWLLATEFRALIEIVQGKRNFFYSDDGETVSGPPYCHWRLGKILPVENLQPIPSLELRYNLFAVRESLLIILFRSLTNECQKLFSSPNAIAVAPLYKDSSFILKSPEMESKISQRPPPLK